MALPQHQMMRQYLFGDSAVRLSERAQAPAPPRCLAGTRATRMRPSTRLPVARGRWIPPSICGCRLSSLPLTHALPASGQGGLHGREMEEWQRRFHLPVGSRTGSHVTDSDPVTTAKVLPRAGRRHARQAPAFHFCNRDSLITHGSTMFLRMTRRTCVSGTRSDLLWRVLAKPSADGAVSHQLWLFCDRSERME
jgi:hypothetical protein